ncbi:MAG: hypothetical protein Kow00129_11380 [Thermoleophilia bacterium]
MSTEETRKGADGPPGSAETRAREMRRRKEQVVLETLRRKASGVDLRDVALSLGVGWAEDGESLEFEILGEGLVVRPDLSVVSKATARQASWADAAIVLNALVRPGGHPGSGWKTFREFAGGHAGDFREEAEKPLAFHAEEIAARAQEAASAVSGRVVDPVAGSDVTFEVPVFPHVRALVQVFREDMEFPAEARILFTEGADRFLPPGCLEELGSRLARKIIAAVTG